MKFKKLLAFVLSLCVVFGTVAIAVSGAESTAAQTMFLELNNEELSLYSDIYKLNGYTYAFTGKYILSGKTKWGIHFRDSGTYDVTVIDFDATSDDWYSSLTFDEKNITLNLTVVGINNFVGYNHPGITSNYSLSNEEIANGDILGKVSLTMTENSSILLSNNFPSEKISVLDGIELTMADGSAVSGTETAGWRNKALTVKNGTPAAHKHNYISLNGKMVCEKCGYETKKITQFSVGETLEYGWYPQSKVEDATTIAALNTQAGVDSSDIKASTASWTSYGYYSGTGKYDGLMTAKDYMRYTDVIYNGNKYRGVVFDTYRPRVTTFTSSSDGISTYQDNNGYNTNTVYWFKYEPITWRVLDPAKGLVMSETLLDSQAFNNYLIKDEEEDNKYYGDENKTHFANNYEHSSIRKWLTNDFINTAFSGSQQNIMAETEVKTQKYGEESISTTYDKIYLLSESEVKNSDYGFSSSAARQAQGSDYAKSQGLWVLSKSGKSYWRLRSAGHGSGLTCRVGYDGYVDRECNTTNTDIGVRPAFNFNLTSDIVQQPVVKEKITDYFVGDTLEYGWYPQSKVTDSGIISQLNSTAGDNKSWTSYGYYSGTGKYDGQMTAKDYMRYTDVIYNGNKYRGVVIDTYRPCQTTETSSSDMSNNNTHQDDNGYTPNNVYWFKYEPITWRVLDPAKGLVMSETLLDSQPYNNYILSSNGEYYGNEQLKYTDADNNEKDWFANNYEKSSIREWLNEDFYSTAFSSSQQNVIATTELDNSAYRTDYSKYNSATTKDKIYLLSYADALNESYGFSSDYSEFDIDRRAQGSDYAKSQGLWVSTSGKSYWRLRSAGNSSCGVFSDGNVSSYCSTDNTSDGVRPAFNFNPKSAITQCDVSEVGVAKYTVETYTMKTDGEYEKTTASFTGGVGTTATAKYIVPEGFTLGANSKTEGEIVSGDSLVLKVYFDRNKYVLTTKVDGVTTPYEFYYGQTVSGIPNPTKQGYAFNGWDKTVPATMPAESVTVTAQFIENSNYTVKFNTDGGTPAIGDKTGVKWTDTVLSGVTAPVKTGYEFVGWYVGIDAVGAASQYKDFVANDTVTEITLTARWTENSNYTVKFNTDGGTPAIGDKTGVKWTDTVLSGVTAPTKQGYEFVGWYVGVDAVGATSQYKDFVANDTVTEITLTARWKDAEAPVISGIENGTAYCIGKTFTVSDNIAVTSVTANGKELTPDFAGKYTLDTASGETQIVASDAEGNKSSVTVTVNDHNYKWGECTDCGAQDPDMCPFFRFIIDFFKWIIKIMNDFVVWIKTLPEAFIGMFK